MRDYRLPIGAIVCALVSFVFGAVSHADAQERISLSATLSETTDGIANVVVSFKIDEGWHAYESTEVGQALQVSLELPDDVVPAGRWQKPESIAYKEDTTIYKGEGSFSRKLAIADSDSIRQIVVTVAYQVCTETGCMAPDEAQFELTVAAATPAVAAKKGDYDFGNSHFATPELLMADGKLLNVAAHQQYISPTMHDVDNDGVLELVTGDVAGKVRVYENTNDQFTGTPVWEDAGFLSNTGGEPLMAKNW